MDTVQAGAEAGGFDLDPRWQRKPTQPAVGATAAQQSVALGGSGGSTPTRQASFTVGAGREGSFRRPPVQQDSFRNDTNSLSIVFNAQWVHLLNPIGEGAFSRVFEGVYTNPDTNDESVVAVKILKKNMLKRRSDCLRFIKEAKIMTKINHRRACVGAAARRGAWHASMRRWSAPAAVHHARQEGATCNSSW